MQLFTAKVEPNTPIFQIYDKCKYEIEGITYLCTVKSVGVDTEGNLQYFIKGIDEEHAKNPFMVIQYNIESWVYPTDMKPLAITQK